MVSRTRVLFVCAGNTCRSPMAAALARFLFPDVEAESAGWSPQDSIAGEAVTVVREVTGLDIRGHRPRDLADLDLSEFDRIIVLDRTVAAEIELPADPAYLVWDIPDPYGRPLEAYRRCAALLRDEIEALAADA
jgi:protein-tyrosine-phosphatase